MSDSNLIAEFKRWLKADKPAVWVKRKAGWDEWTKQTIVCWSQPDTVHYIVDDEQAELRKLAIDEPETRFQFLGTDDKWCDKAVKDNFYQNIEYRIKPKEWYEDEYAFGIPVWARDSDDGDDGNTTHWKIDIFRAYKKDAKFKYRCSYDNWEYAKPVKPEECYQGVNNDL